MPAQAQVLVVDDDVAIGRLLRTLLGNEGLKVGVAHSALEARRAVADTPPHLVVLDVGLPGEDGFSVAKWLRSSHPEVGVVMLTSLSDIEDRLEGLQTGADDYIAKPFDGRELVARVRNVLRRVVRLDASVIPISGGWLSSESHTLYDQHGAPVPLTPTEFDLLLVLAQHPQRVLSRERLLDRVFGVHAISLERSVDFHICNLRAKLGRHGFSTDIIKTIRGVGYMFTARH